MNLTFYLSKKYLKLLKNNFEKFKLYPENFQIFIKIRYFLKSNNTVTAGGHARAHARTPESTLCA